MDKYRARAELVEAVQICEDDFTGDHPNPRHVAGVRYIPTLKQAVVNSPEGQQIAVDGDWIVISEQSVVRRYKPDEFAARYMAVPDTDVLAVAMAEVARLRERIAQLPNPTPPDNGWKQRYIAWWIKYNGAQTAKEQT